MKKKGLGLVLAIISIITIIVFWYLYNPIFYAHDAIIKQSHLFETQSLTSFDNKYVLETYLIEDNTGAYASFFVRASDNEDKIYSCNEKYRTMDLKSISWDDSTLDILVKSGDVGNVSYKFTNNTWEKQ